MKLPLAVISVILSFLSLSQPAMAAADFELRPSKTELLLNPGEQARRELLITNQTTLMVEVDVSIEDFAAGSNPRDPVQLFDSEINPFSLKPFITPGFRSIILPPGQSANVPISVSLASTTAPGGLYGAVIFSFSPIGQTANAVSRLGALFFVRVRGEAKEEGKLAAFGRLGPRTFHLDYANTGNVHLNPYGQLTIINRLTGQSRSKIIDPWFVLPNSVRLREIGLDEDLAVGWYQAQVALNRGYDDIVDEASIAFIVWSWFAVELGLLVGLILSMLVWLIRSKIKKP